MKILDHIESFVNKPICISLFDWSLSWSAVYAENGYRLLPVDLKWGINILSWDYQAIPKHLVKVILAAPPCTDFSVSGAQYWKEKDQDGRTDLSVQLVHKSLEIIKYFNPPVWALENPVGRINKLVPELGHPFYWQPFWYGDPWTKKTGLWGKFTKPMPDPVEPVRHSDQGSYTQLLGGKSDRTKELRSVTPPHFSKQFFKANNPI